MMLVSAYQFDVHPRFGEPTPACLAGLRDEVAKCLRHFFVTKKAPIIPAMSFEGVCETPLQGYRLLTDHHESTTHSLATVLMEYPHIEPTATWIGRYTMACDSRSVAFAYTTELISLTPILRPSVCRSPRHPALDAIVNTWQCSIEGYPVPGCVEILCDNKVEQFVSLVLLNPKRLLPVVVIADAPPEIDPSVGRISNLLRGLCHLVVLSGPAATEALARLLGPRLACAQGIRLYWPGFDERSSPAENPYWSLALQPDLVGLELYDRITQVSAYRYQESHLIREARTSLGVTAPEFHSPPTAGGTDVSSPQKLHDELGKLRGECYHLECQNSDMKREIVSFKEGVAAAQDRIRDLENQLTKARDAAKRAHQEVERERDLQHQVEELRAHRETFRKERDLAQRDVQVLQERLAQAQATLKALGKADHLDGAEHDKKTWEELCAEVERTWDENKHLRSQLESTKQQLADLEAKLENYEQHYWMPSEEEGNETATENMEVGGPTFVSVTDALLAASTAFDDVLTVWDDAWESARESMYSSPESTYRALQAIAEVGRDYFSSQAGGRSLGPIELAFRGRVPFKYANFESQTTLARYGDERIFHHHNESRQMQRHLTLGGGQRNNCLQIYFEFDDVTRRVLVGYCGRHLSYARNRT